VSVVTHPASDATDRRSLAILLTGNVLFAAGLIVHAILFNFYIRELGHTASAMGYQVAAMTIGGLCGLLPAGFVIDTRGTRTALLLGGTVTVAGLVVTALTHSLFQIYAGAFIVGVGGATCRVAWGPAIMRLTTERTRSRVFAWNTALLIGSGSFWTVFAGLGAMGLAGLTVYVELSPLQVTLLIGAALSACALPLYAMLPPATRASAPSASISLLPPPEVRVLVPLVALWMLAAALVLPFFNIWLTDRFGMTVAHIGQTFAGVQLLTAGVLVVAGEVARRFGARRVLIVWMSLMAPALLGLSVVSVVGAAIALYFVQGIVGPATNPLIDQVLLERAPVARHGIVAGWRNAAAEASGAIGATIGGRLLDATTFHTLFVIAAVVAAVSAIALGASLRTSETLLPERA
jgi:MFS family permease